MKSNIYLFILMYITPWNTIFTGENNHNKTSQSIYYTPESSSGHSPSGFDGENKEDQERSNIKSDITKLFNRTQEDYENIEMCFEKFKNLTRKIKNLYASISRETERRQNISKEIQDMKRNISDIQRQTALLVTFTNQVRHKEHIKKRNHEENDQQQNRSTQNNEVKYKRQRII